MKSPSGDDDGHAHAAFPRWREDKDPKVPCIAIPDYNPQVVSVSLRTPVPSPAGGASTAAPSIPAVATKVSASSPPVPVAGVSPMQAEEDIPVLVANKVAPAAPFPLRSVPAPFACLSLPVVTTVVPPSPAPFSSCSDSFGGVFSSSSSPCSGCGELSFYSSSSFGSRCSGICDSSSFSCCVGAGNFSACCTDFGCGDGRIWSFPCRFLRECCCSCL